MPVSSLYELAKSRLIANIRHLDDIGDLPYDFLAPVLRHIQSPAQLAALESTCPQIRGETGEIWLRFIKRDIPQWERRPHEPRDPKNWSKVYNKLMKECEKEKAKQEEDLRQKMKAILDKKEEKTLILEGTVAGRRTGGSGSFGRFGGGSSGWGSSGAPKQTGKVAFDKLRRGIFDQKKIRPKAAQLPTHLLQERRGVVKAAPERLVRMSENKARAESGAQAAATSSANAQSATAARPAPKIRHVSASSPEAPAPPQRPRLPQGHQFSAPKVKTQPASAPVAQKRKREEPNLFMAKKKKG
jgi:elongin-A